MHAGGSSASKEGSPPGRVLATLDDVPIALRPALPADLPGATRLAVLLVHQHHAYDPQRFALFGSHGDLERGYAGFLAHEMDDPQAVILVAVDEGEGEGASDIVGYAYGRIEPPSYQALLDTYGALHDLYVDERVRGRGLARRLVTEMLARLRALGAPRVVLSTAQENANAQAMFAKLGFRRTMIEMTCELGV